MTDPRRAEMLALFRTTPHAGRGGPDWSVGEAGHALTESRVRWHWRVVAGRIAEARYEVRGCPDLIAVAELAAESLEGQPAATATVDVAALAARLGTPAGKLGKLLTVEDAVRVTAIQFGRR